MNSLYKAYYIDIIPGVAAFMTLIAGIFFLSQTRQRQTMYFLATFLLAESICLLLYPLSLSKMYSPSSIIILAIRFSFLLGIAAPMNYLTALSLRNKISFKKAILIMTPGILAAITYAVFHFLGNFGTTNPFDFEACHRNFHFIKNMKAPFYPREVTAATFLIAAFYFFATTIQCWKVLKRKLVPTPVYYTLYGIGSFLFGLLICIAVYYLEFNLIYFGAFFCSLLIIIGLAKIQIERQENLRASLPTLRMDLYSLLSGLSPNPTRMQDIFNILEVLERPNRCLIFQVLSSDSSPETLNKLIQLINKKIGVKGNSFCTPSANRLVLLVAMNNEQCTDFAEGICDELPELSAGVGRCKPINTLPESYQEANRALDYSVQFPDSTVIFIDECPPAQQDNAYPIHLKEEFLNALKLGNADKAEKLFRQLIDKLKTVSQGQDAILKIRLKELGTVMLEYALLGGADKEIIYKNSLNLGEEIFKIRDISELTKRLHTEMTTVINIIVDSRQLCQHSVIKKALDFMQNNYSGNITLPQVAHTFEVSPSHLKSLFQKETDTTFSQKLKDIRMHNACEFLLKTHMNVSEIADATGYNNSNYFSSVFKKTYNMTPSEFRTPH